MSSRNKPDNLEESTSKSTFPQRPRHQIQRSISELSPSRLPKHQDLHQPQQEQQKQQHRHHHHRRHHRRSRRDVASDELNPSSASSMPQFSRRSFELGRSERTASPHPAVDHDPRSSFLSSVPDGTSATAGMRSAQLLRGKDRLVGDRDRMVATITFVGLIIPSQE